MGSRFLNIVIPMAGSGSRFLKAGYKDPKPLIDVFGKPMITQVIKNLIPMQDFKFIFICQKDDFEQYELSKIFTSILGSNWSCKKIDKITEGPACTVMLAKDLFSHSHELIIANSDQIIDSDINNFIRDARETNSDGFIMTFLASEDRWSFVKVDSEGFVTEVAEKKVISNNATVGIYYFSSCELFYKGFQEMVKKNLRVNEEFYVAPVYNELILFNKKIKIWNINSNHMNGIGTPNDLEIFFKKKGGYLSKSSPNFTSCSKK